MNEHEEFQLLYPSVFPVTVPILVNYETGRDDLGAGVLVEISDRLFVATAAHCIEEKPRILKDHFYLPYDDESIQILDRGTDDDLDVGFLELKNDPSIPTIARARWSLDQIHVGDPPKPSDGMLFVVGFPVSGRTNSPQLLEVRKEGLGSRMNRAEDTFYFLEYPAMGWKNDAKTGGFVEVPFPETPVGFSGGGWWAFFPQKDGEVFYPQKYIRLYAIQSSWFSKSRLVKCVPMIHWLRLVATACPDLRESLIERFPVLSELPLSGR